MDGFGRHERGDAPPILTLLDLIEEHRPAFEYDWRTRFGCRFDVPAPMALGFSSQGRGYGAGRDFFGSELADTNAS